MAAIAPHLEACGAMLERRELTNLGFLGRFKAGSDRFSAERTVLSIGIISVTAVITRLRYGPQEQATVRYSQSKRRSYGVRESDCNHTQ